MTSMRISRLAAPAALGLALISAVYATPAASSTQARSASSYTLVATLPDVVDGQPLRDFAFDDKTRRLYAGSDRGLFWSDLSEENPVFNGPLFRKDIRRIEMAPDLGRVFYITETEVGYLDVRGTSPEPVTVVAGRLWGTELVYEPTRQQVYVATGTSRVVVLDARSGERAPDITLPGWSATGLEAVPGRVFMNVSGKNGIYQIDAATHAVTVWPVESQLVTPAHFEADPAGRTLFAAYDQFIVAIDIASGKQLGRITTTSSPAMAFDPGTGWLVTSWADARPRLRLKAFDVNAQGFAEMCEMDNPALGGFGLEPTAHGFIQRGHKSLLVWAAK